MYKYTFTIDVIMSDARVNEIYHKLSVTSIHIKGKCMFVCMWLRHDERMKQFINYHIFAFSDMVSMIHLLIT